MGSFLQIYAKEPDDFRYCQRVTVKPNAQYLLTGWIKTKDVPVFENGGSRGANLYVSLPGTAEPMTSRGLTRSTDWTYATLSFRTGTIPRSRLDRVLGSTGALPPERLGSTIFA